MSCCENDFWRDLLNDANGAIEECFVAEWEVELWRSHSFGGSAAEDDGCVFIHCLEFVSHFGGQAGGNLTDLADMKVLLQRSHLFLWTQSAMGIF